MNNKTHLIRDWFLLPFGFIGGLFIILYFNLFEEPQPKETYLPEPYLSQKATLILKCSIHFKIKS